MSFFLYYTGLLSIIKWLFRLTAGEKDAVVLLYHRVVDPTQRNGSMPEMTVSPDMFAAQMEYISDHYLPISLEDYLLKSFTGCERYPCFMVTFDDGWRDNYLNAYPILKKYRVPALIFLTTGYIGNSRLFWPERLAKVLKPLMDGKSGTFALEQAVKLVNDILARKPDINFNPLSSAGISNEKRIKALIENLKFFPITEIEALIAALKELLTPGHLFQDGERLTLDWEEVKTMAQEFISFGAHTRNHIILDQVGDSMLSEVGGSKRDIEESLGVEVKAFAYPNGRYNEEVIKAVRKAGYRVAFTTKFGVNNRSTPLLELRRIRIDDRFSKGLLGGFSKCLFEFEIARNLIQAKININ